MLVLVLATVTTYAGLTPPPPDLTTMMHLGKSASSWTTTTTTTSTSSSSSSSSSSTQARQDGLLMEHTRQLRMMLHKLLLLLLPDVLWCHVTVAAAVLRPLLSRCVYKSACVLCCCRCLELPTQFFCTLLLSIVVVVMHTCTCCICCECAEHACVLLCVSFFVCMCMSVLTRQIRWKDLVARGFDTWRMYQWLVYQGAAPFFWYCHAQGM